jgi:hypothetical protein
MKKISWTTCVKTEVLHIVNEERSIIHAVKRRKPNGIGYIFDGNCLLKHIIEGRIEVTGEDEEEDVSSHWITLRKREDTGN